MRRLWCCDDRVCREWFEEDIVNVIVLCIVVRVSVLESGR